MLDFNIYVYNVTSDELVAITTDGVEDEIYNGIPDWVYEGMCVYIRTSDKGNLSILYCTSILTSQEENNISKCLASSVHYLEVTCTYYRIHATCMHAIVGRKREEKGFGFTL